MRRRGVADWPEADVQKAPEGVPLAVRRLNRSTQHFILDGKMECIQ